MAISGSFYGTTSNAAIKPKITWTAEAEPESNSSVVTAKLSYSRTDSYTTYGHWAGSLTIHGDRKTVSGKYVEITKNSNTVTITHTVRVPHADNGSKTITISATGGITDTSLTKTNISAAVTLETIPRAASVAATDGDIGSISMVTIGKKSDGYTYTLAYRFGNLSGYLSDAGLTDTAAEVTAASLPFPLPEAFYYEIPDSASAPCTLICTTFLEGSPVGEPQSTSFLVRAAADRCGPVLQVTVEDTNAGTLALTGYSGKLIRYASTACCRIQAQPRYGAVITEKLLNGEPVEGDSVTLSQVQTDRLTVTVRDSRGHSTQQVLALELIPYFLPTVRLEASRTDATSGNGWLQAEGTFFAGSFGAAANSLQIQYRIGTGTPVSVTPQLEGSRYSLRIPLQDLDYTKSYQIYLTVSDALTAVTAQAQIHPGIPVFEWGREDFHFHVPVLVQGKDLLTLVEEGAQNRVNRAGDSMTGSLEMSGNRITGLGVPLNGPDAATKAYADGKLQLCRLWENASPTSTFAAQTIPLDLTEFDGVMVTIKFKNDGADTRVTTGFVPKGIKGQGMVTNEDTGSLRIRMFTASDSGVEFAKGIKMEDASTSAGNAVPTCIYGVKGVAVWDLP